MSTFKQVIWSLTDFEFLASLSSVDFHKRSCHIKPHFYNTLIGMIKDNVEINSKRDLYAIIHFIKDLYLQRLGLVSPHSMVRFFRDQIKISFGSFKRRLEKFFLLKTESVTTNEETTTTTKAEKKRLRRKAAKLRRRQREAELKENGIAEPITNDEADPEPQAELPAEEEISEPSNGSTNDEDSMSESSVEESQPLVEDSGSESDRYEQILENLDVPAEFIREYGVDNYETFKSKIVYEDFLDWQSNQARITMESDEE